MEKIFAWTPEQGSRQLVWAAIGGRDQEDEMKGTFVARAARNDPSDFVLSAEGKKMQDTVWVSAVVVSSIFLTLTDILRKVETIDILNHISPKVQSVVQEFLI